MKMLRLGSVGIDVRRVQQALNRRMLFPNNQLTSPRLARLAEDANFGPRTRAMVLEFQRLNRIQPDGVVGPITSFLLFPYATFAAQLSGNGRIRGRQSESGSGKPAERVSVKRPLRGATKAKEPTVGDSKEEEEGLTLQASVGQGLKHEFRPWFVLKPDEGPEGAKSSATVTVEAVVLRKAGFEFSGEFEFSRKLPAASGKTWIWEAAIKGTYTDMPTVGGGILTPLSPSASLKLGQGGAVGVGLGGEASIRLIQDTLELSVGGEVAVQLNPHDGNLEVGGEVSGALKLNLDVVRRLIK